MDGCDQDFPSFLSLNYPGANYFPFPYQSPPQFEQGAMELGCTDMDVEMTYEMLFCDFIKEQPEFDNHMQGWLFGEQGSDNQHQESAIPTIENALPFPTYTPDNHHQYQQQQTLAPFEVVEMIAEGYFPPPSPSILLPSSVDVEHCDCQGFSNDSHEIRDESGSPGFFSSKYESTAPSTAGPITPMHATPNDQLGCMSEANTMHLLRQLQAVQEREREHLRAALENDQEQPQIQSSIHALSQNNTASVNDYNNVLTQTGNDREHLQHQQDQEVVPKQLMTREIKHEVLEDDEMLSYVGSYQGMEKHSEVRPCEIRNHDDDHSHLDNNNEGEPSFLHSTLRNATDIVDSGAVHESVVRVQAHGPTTLVTQTCVRQEVEQHQRCLEHNEDTFVATDHSSTSGYAEQPTIDYRHETIQGNPNQDQTIQEVYQTQHRLVNQSDYFTVFGSTSPTVLDLNQSMAMHQDDYSSEDDQKHEPLLLQQPLSQH
ncbi:hypothetical protein BGZ46_005293, partial [Entomortierella lignicola]